MGKVAGKIPVSIVLLACAFFIAGFGTKAGLIPFHAWLPDAHAEAPTPISALLSGIVIKVGAYALVRTITVFAPSYNAVVVFVAIMASVSMLVGICLALVQDDLKRMLAYSSISQIAYVIEGIGLGTYLGIYGGLFHLINHTLIKGLLFLTAGALLYMMGTRSIRELQRMPKKMPITLFCFFVGALAIAGMPPFNGFLSKFTLFLAIAQRGLLWAAVIAVLTSLLTLACFARAAYRIFWSKPATQPAANPGIKEVPFSLWMGMGVLAMLCIVIGMYPRLVHPILERATQCILKILGG
jgi:formate hydrogenlyase subunit 3/multisubunit Na+/H+ antiporter MnhD subunit